MPVKDHLDTNSWIDLKYSEAIIPPSGVENRSYRSLPYGNWMSESMEEGVGERAVDELGLNARQH